MPRPQLVIAMMSQGSVIDERCCCTSRDRSVQVDKGITTDTFLSSSRHAYVLKLPDGNTLRPFCHDCSSACKLASLDAQIEGLYFEN
jgi:hypothetical protein